jgi:hypothetical protein
MLEIYPDKIKNFSNEYRNKKFCLIITEFLSNKIAIKPSRYYEESVLVICKADEKINDILERLPKDADLFFIPYLYNEHPFPQPSDLTTNQRFLMLSCTQSTPVTLEGINYFLNLIYASDPKKFYQACEFADAIEFVNQKHSTVATLQINEELLLSEICGNLEPRQIGVVPSGEIAFSHKHFHEMPPISLDGTIVLLGHPILHCHTFTQEAFNYQLKLFNKFLSLQKNAMELTVKDGKIIYCQAIDRGAKKSVQALNELFETDSRYQIIIEIGIGLNQHLKLLEYNSSMNETYGGDDMCIHFGIGIAPATLFHLDVICPDTQLKINTGKVLVKGSRPNLQLQDAMICPCNL